MLSEKRLTPKDFAALAGVTLTNLAKMEARKQLPRERRRSLLDAILMDLSCHLVARPITRGMVAPALEAEREAIAEAVEFVEARRGDVHLGLILICRWDGHMRPDLFIGDPAEIITEARKSGLIIQASFLSIDESVRHVRARAAAAGIDLDGREGRA